MRLTTVMVALLAVTIVVVAGLFAWSLRKTETVTVSTSVTEVKSETERRLEQLARTVPSVDQVTTLDSLAFSEEERRRPVDYTNSQRYSQSIFEIMQGIREPGLKAFWLDRMLEVYGEGTPISPALAMSLDFCSPDPVPYLMVVPSTGYVSLIWSPEFTSPESEEEKALAEGALAAAWVKYDHLVHNRWPYSTEKTEQDVSYRLLQEATSLDAMFLYVKKYYPTADGLIRTHFGEIYTLWEAGEKNLFLSRLYDKCAKDRLFPIRPEEVETYRQPVVAQAQDLAQGYKASY